MPIYKVHESVIIMNSIDARFSRNIYEVAQKPRSTYFIGAKTTRLRLMVLKLTLKTRKSLDLQPCPFM